MSLQRFPDMVAALEAEDAMFERLSACRQGFEHMMWTGHRSLVAPRTFAQNRAFSDAASNSASDGWPVLLRKTGGDIVPQGPGTLNLTMAWTTPIERGLSIAQGYMVLCDALMAVFGGECAKVEAAFCDGAYNVVVGGRKVAGTAQRRRTSADRIVTLAHALILVSDPIDPGVAAVNRFMSQIGRKGHVRPEAHVNAGEILSDPALMPATLAARLSLAIDGLQRETWGAAA